MEKSYDREFWDGVFAMMAAAIDQRNKNAPPIIDSETFKKIMDFIEKKERGKERK